MLSLHTEGVQQAFSHTLPSAPYVGHTMSSAPPATDDELSQASASIVQSEVWFCAYSDVQMLCF